MKTLIIYDNEGTIVSQFVSPYKIPCGLPYIEVEIPNDSYIVSVVAETSEPVYEKLPQTREDILTKKIDILQTENADLLLDSAVKDSEIKTLKNDLADLTVEIAMIGGK